ncbi:MAG: transglycosylase domain-containing protein [Candidatus Wildermuthbacteria bacterium]|nr:transglycosylase domain-containing protein [Candidatus Wildermuthbacteria bacterium]
MKTRAQKNNHAWFDIIKKILKFGGAGFALCVLLFAGIFLYYAKDLPRPERLSEVSFANPTKIYDNTGTVLLYEIHGEEKRQFTPLSEISPFLSQAVLAVEDQRFYNHMGVDAKGVARAVLNNIVAPFNNNPAIGGSTISQQLVRSILLTREKTVGRKVRELILTLELERRYAKDEILEFYLNQIPWGQNAYGIGAASELYFQKTPRELSLAESAALAAMIQAPTFYSPYGAHLDALLKRRNIVLGLMASLEFISQEQFQEALRTSFDFQESALPIKAPHFVFDVLETLTEKYGEDFLRERGLTVITSLDWNIQQKAEEAVAAFAERNSLFNANNEALVALDPHTGKVLALVGSKDWFGEPFPERCAPGKTCLFDPKVNVATFSPGRQPGSSFKPFVYAVALGKGYPDSFVVEDALTNFGVWGGKEYIPQNYDGLFRGPVSLRSALAQSLNIPAIKVLLSLSGIEPAVQMAKELGITTLNDASYYGPSLVLGGGEVKLLDMVSAYGVFAAGGKKASPLSIVRVIDKKGRVLEENKNTPIQVLAPEVASAITDILSDNDARAPMFGLHSSLVVPGFNVAVKTGTTQEYKDAWTIGYSENLSAGVWVGNNDNTPMAQAGVMVAAPIWNRFMTEALPLLFKKQTSLAAPE